MWQWCFSARNIKLMRRVLAHWLPQNPMAFRLQMAIYFWDVIGHAEWFCVIRWIVAGRNCLFYCFRADGSLFLAKDWAKEALPMFFLRCCIVSCDRSGTSMPCSAWSFLHSIVWLADAVSPSSLCSAFWHSCWLGKASCAPSLCNPSAFWHSLAVLCNIDLY